MKIDELTNKLRDYLSKRGGLGKAWEVIPPVQAYKAVKQIQTPQWQQSVKQPIQKFGQTYIKSPTGEMFPKATWKKPQEEQSKIWSDYFRNLTFGATMPPTPIKGIDPKIARSVLKVGKKATEKEITSAWKGLMKTKAPRTIEELASRYNTNTARLINNAKDVLIREAGRIGVAPKLLAGKVAEAGLSEPVLSSKYGKVKLRIRPVGELPQAEAIKRISLETKGVKERGFVTTVKKAEATAKDVVEKIEGYYSPRSTRQLIDKARQEVSSNYDLAKTRINVSPFTDETNAIGQELMRQAQNAGRFDEATEIAEILAKKGTEAGQTVQAFSIWGRLTPEGMVKYAAKLFSEAEGKLDPITKAVRGALKKEKIKLTPKDTKYLTNIMKKANTVADEVEKAKYVKKAFEYIGKKLPWGVVDVIDEYRYNNMLSNPLTHLRNVVSNLQQTYITRPATLVAEGRSIEAVKYEIGALGGLPKAFKSFTKAIKEGTPLGKMDVAGISKLKPIKPKRLGKIANLPSTALEAADQFFGTLIREGELARGATLEDATKTASYSLFRQDLHPEGQGILLNKIDDITRAVYGLRKVGLGWFIPFIRTPMNVAKQWIEYSPAGVLTAAGAANKRSQLAKALVGSVVTAIGANIALEGRTTWAVPTDPEQKKLFYDSGRKPYSVKVGNKWIPMQTFGVYAWALGIPAAVKYFNEESRTALTDDQFDKLTKMIVSPLGFWSNQTFVSGLGSFVKLAEGDTDYTLPKNIAYTLGQLKPMAGLMRYISTKVDPIFRKPSGFKQMLYSDIPFATKNLPYYETYLGKPAKRNITNYIAPYAMGIENKEYEPLYQLRTKELQQNAVLNKMEKEMEQKLNRVTGDEVSAAEGLPPEADLDKLMQEKQAEMELKLLKKQFEYSEEDYFEHNNRLYYKTDTGTSSVSLDFEPTEPKLTGEKELDAELIADYKGELTTIKNNAIKAFGLGAIDQKEVMEVIKRMNALRNALKKPSTKKIKAKQPKFVPIKFGKRKRITGLTKSKAIKLVRAPKLKGVKL